MSSVFDDLDAQRQRAMDIWVFDKLPFTAQQKAQFLATMQVKEETKTKPLANFPRKDESVDV